MDMYLKLSRHIFETVQSLGQRVGEWRADSASPNGGLVAQSGLATPPQPSHSTLLPGPPVRGRVRLPVEREQQLLI